MATRGGDKITRKIISRVLETEVIPRGSTVILGFSGGPDSLCLLHVLYTLSDELELNIVPVHVNHKLRGEKSDQEAANAIAICNKWDLPCHTFEADCTGLAKALSVSNEEAGRIIRYEIFDEVALAYEKALLLGIGGAEHEGIQDDRSAYVDAVLKGIISDDFDGKFGGNFGGDYAYYDYDDEFGGEYGDDNHGNFGGDDDDYFDEFDEPGNYESSRRNDRIFIAVAHNADDQSETVLFRLLRGTGVHGLAGISSARLSAEGFIIARPLLDVSRADIEAYIKENKLKPNMDESNESTDYTRNKIRNELLPYLEKNYNPNVKEALRRYAMIAELDDNFMDGIAKGAFLDVVEVKDDNIILDIDKLEDMHIAVIRRVIVIILSGFGPTDSISFELIGNLLNLLYSENPSAQISLPNGFVACREYNTLVFRKANEDDKVDPCEGLRLMPQIMKRKAFMPADDELYAAFDFDAFSEKYPGRVGEIVLRTRREGDYIAIKDGKSKKLQDYLVDSKVKKSERDDILLVAIENEILWIIPSANLPTAQQRDKGKYSQNYQINDTTERVLFLELVDSL